MQHGSISLQTAIGIALSRRKQGTNPVGSLRGARSWQALLYLLYQNQECEGRANSRPRENLGQGVRPRHDARPEDGRQDGDED
jgi:hypothetical protein